ncbi:MAG: hypothetical protein WCA38_15255 [Candidatus Acidiferrales bacterium]
MECALFLLAPTRCTDTRPKHLHIPGLFTLWKDSDPDIPILIAAKAGYATLQ